MADQKNIFVLGLEAFNAAKLKALPSAEPCNFLPLLDYSDVKKRRHYPVRELLANASDQLARFPGGVDAIVGYWDFPVSTMLPILCAEHGVRALARKRPEVRAQVLEPAGAAKGDLGARPGF